MDSARSIYLQSSGETDLLLSTASLIDILPVMNFRKVVGFKLLILEKRIINLAGHLHDGGVKKQQDSINIPGGAGAAGQIPIKGNDMKQKDDQLQPDVADSGVD